MLALELMLAWNDVGDRAGAVTGVRVGIFLVMVVAQVGAVGLQVRVDKFGCSSLGVQVGVCRSVVVNSWFPSFDGVSLPTTLR
jgi:hypothetical protein